MAMLTMGFAEREETNLPRLPQAMSMLRYTPTNLR
jgi:hypothetical protein